MRKFAYTESQKEVITSVLASLEDVGTTFPELEQVEIIDSAPICGHVQDFCEKMDALFKKYEKDGCMNGYHRDDDLFTVEKKDAGYIWCALDGAVHMYNMIHPGHGHELVIVHGHVTETTKTFIVQYAVDC